MWAFCFLPVWALIWSPFQHWCLHGIILCFCNKEIKSWVNLTFEFLFEFLDWISLHNLRCNDEAFLHNFLRGRVANHSSGKNLKQIHLRQDNYRLPILSACCSLGVHGHSHTTAVKFLLQQNSFFLEKLQKLHREHDAFANVRTSATAVFL